MLAAIVIGPGDKMFHLLNRTYLDLSASLENTVNCILISEDLAKYPFTPDPTIDHGRTVYHVASSYDELINDNFYGNESALFSFLVGVPYTDRFTLYADPAAFETILVKWLKTILSNATNDELYIVYRLTMLKLKMIHSQIAHSPQDRKDTYNNLVVLDRAAWDAAYATMEPFAPTLLPDPSFKTNISLEWLLADWLNDENSPYAAEFKSRVEKIAWKSVGWEINELRRNLLNAMFDLDTLWPSDFTTELDFATADFADVVGAKPELAFLQDMSCSAHDLTSLQGYDIDALTTLAYDYMDITGTDDAHLRTFWPYITAGGTLDVKGLVEYDRDLKFGTQVFARTEYRHKMNPMLISYFYHLSRTNDTATLARFAL